MKKIVIVALAISTLIQSCGSSNSSEKSEVTPTEALKLSKENVLFVDVRSTEESEEQGYKVKNLINIPLDELEQNLDKLPKDKQLVLVCKSGNRSAQAFDILKEKGYSKISSMSGGMNEWSNLNYPTLSGKACCANPNSKDCNPDGTCKPKVKEACCEDSSSAKCNPDGTCKDEKSCTTEEKKACNTKSKDCCKPESK